MSADAIDVAGESSRQEPGTMRQLAAMIRMDLLTARGFALLIGVIVSALVLMSMAELSVFSVGDFLPPMMLALPLVLIANLSQTIDASRLTLLYGALPLRRSVVVASHYVLVMATVCLLAVPGLLSWFLGRAPDGGLEVAGAAGTAFVLLAFALPMYIELGVQRAGLTIMVSVLVLTAAFVWARSAFDLRLPRIDESLFAVGLLTVGVLAMVVSYVVSVGFYGRQDH